MMSIMSATLCLRSTYALPKASALFGLPAGMPHRARDWVSDRRLRGPKNFLHDLRVEGILLFFPLLIFLHSKSDDSSHQVVRNRLADWKLDRTFSLFVR